jgi:hypothetical protein
MRGLVVDPIVRAITALCNAMRYVPQDLQWLVVLAIAIIFSAVFVIGRLPQRERRPRRSPPPRFPTEGPTMRVAQMIDESARFKHRHVRLVIELRDLVAHVLARHHGIPVLRAKELLDTEDWTDDPVVRAYLATDERGVGHEDKRRPHTQVDRVLTQIEKINQEA